MKNLFKEKIGEVAYEKLNELLKREANLMYIKGDYELRKAAIELLLTWLGTVYEIDYSPKKIVPELDLDKLFKTRES